MDLHQHGNSIEALYNEQEWLLEVARELVRGDESAEDLAQETWLRVLRYGPGRIRTPRAFLATTLRRLFLSRRQADVSRRRRENAAETEVSAPATEVLVARTETQRLMHRALERLPEETRRIIILRHFGGLPISDCAARERIPIETARSRLRRGLQKLRSELDRDQTTGRSWKSVALLALPDVHNTLQPALAGSIVMGKKTLGIAVFIIALSTSFFVGRSWLAEEEARLDSSNRQEVLMPDHRESRSLTKPANTEARPVNVEELPAETPLAPDVEVEKPEKLIRGRLVDQHGNGIPGAEILAHASAFIPPEMIMDRAALVAHQWKDRTVHVTKTDSEGAFQIVATEPGVHDILAQPAGRHAAAAWSVKPGTEALLRTRRAEPVTFEFNNEAGLPVPGATVLAMHFNMQARRHFYRKTVTDAQGKVRMPQPPKGDILALVVRHRDYVEQSVAPYTAEPAFKKQTVTVMMKRGRSLRVEFIPPPGRSLAEGTTVAVQSRALFAPIIGQLDKEGVLELPHVPILPLLHFRLPDAPFELEADARLDKDRRQRMIDTVARMGEPYMLPDKGPVNLRIQLFELPRVSGIVQDEEGNPAPGVSLELRAVAADLLAMRTDIRKTRSDDNGRFVFADVPVGPRYVAVTSRLHREKIDPERVIDLGAARVTGMNAFVVESGRDHENLVITVASPASVSGQVTDLEGKPLSGIKVTAFRDFGDGRSARRNAAFLMDELASPETTTGADGSFSLSGLPTDYSLRLVAHCSERPQVWSDALSATPGSMIEGIHLRMPSAVRAAFICRDEQGNVLPHCGVTISYPETAPFELDAFVKPRLLGRRFYAVESYTADPDGCFSAMVSPGRIRIAETDNKTEHIVTTRSLVIDTRPDEKPHEIRHSRAVRYRVRLVDDKGTEIPSVHCVLLSVEKNAEGVTQSFTAYSDSKGILTLRYHDIGDVRLVRGVRQIGRKRLEYVPTTTVTLRPGEDVFDLVMKRAE